MKHAYPKSIIFLILFLLPVLAQAQGENTLVIPTNDSDTVTVNPNYSYNVTVNRYPSGPQAGNYLMNYDGVLTIIATNNRPFTLKGSYVIDPSHCLTVYKGTSTRHPIEGFYSGTGEMNIYCATGSVTLHFYTEPSGITTGFNLELCFSQIYNTHVAYTNSTHTGLYWNDVYNYSNYRWWVKYYQTNDNTQSTETHTYLNNRHDSLMALAAGVKYAYRVGRHNGSGYGTSTVNECTLPLHYFRTPKVQDCNTCDHNRDCIDYTALVTTYNRIQCYKGTSRFPDSVECIEPTRHVVNTNTAERAPHTGNALRVVPTGDTASVRIGNDDGGSEGESIVYEIHVDTNDYNLLALQYAVCMLQSGGTGKYLPRFTIRLWDENCQEVEPLCNNRDYIASDPFNFWDPRSDWNAVPQGNGLTCYWRDWSSMAINLSPYHGKVLYLELSTRDGDNATSACWAYFTLHCSRQQIDHLMTCGNQIENTFHAPEGFNYRWYRSDNPDSTLSTTSSLHVVDSGLYQCHVTPTDCDDCNCGYTINALATQRIPHADFEDSITSGRCQFKVYFINRSTVNGLDSMPLWTNEDCETAYWDLGNGQTSTNYNTVGTYTEAGDYTVMLISSIAGGNCADTIYKTIHLEWEHDPPYLDGDSILCPFEQTTLTIHNTTDQQWIYTYGNRTYSNNHSTNLTLMYETTTQVYCVVTDNNQCTDTLRRQITVLPSYDQHFAATICEAQLPYDWRDTTFWNWTYTGNYVFQRQTVNACDSLVTLHLTVLPSYNHYLDLNVCDYTTTYPYADTVYTTLGSHEYTFHLSTGCDSIIHLTLNSITSPKKSYYDTVCQYFPYNGYLFSQTAAQNAVLGTRTLTRHANNPYQLCDSVVTLHLSVFAATDTTITKVIVENDLPYTVAGISFDHAVTDTVIHTTNQHGCDSVITFSLIINRNIYDTVYRSICASDLPYAWDGLTFTNGGMQNVVHPIISNGADSVVTHILTVWPVYDKHYYDTICDDGSSLFGGQTYTSSGVHTQQYVTQHGCDSVESLHLTVGTTYHYTQRDTICNNHLPYLWHDTTLTTTGSSLSATRTFLTQHGCDSSYALTLIVHPTSSSVVHDTVVENNLPHTFNGVTFTDATNNTPITIANHYGCDSVISYTLVVHHNMTTLVDSSMCITSLPFSWNGLTWTAGEYHGMSSFVSQRHASVTKEVTLLSSTLSDSVVRMTLTVYDTFDNHHYHVICDDTSFLFNGTTYTAGGTYTHHLYSLQGCDSVETLHLTVGATYAFAEYDTLCDNALPYSWHDTTLTSTSAHLGATLPRHTVLGCDSNYTISLTIHPTYSYTYHDTNCNNTLPYTWQESTLGTLDMAATTLVASHMRSSRHACDSLETLLLTVYEVTYGTVRDTVVENSLPRQYQGVSYSSDHADTTYTLVGHHGCDSLVTYSLHVHWNVHTVYDSTVCDNFLPLSWGLQPFLVSAADSVLLSQGIPVTLSRIDTMTAHTGADSIATLTLHVNPTFQVHRFDTICNDTSYTFLGSVYTATGIYPHSLGSSQGCDSLEILHLTVHDVTYATHRDTVVENSLPVSWLHRTFTHDMMSGAEYQQQGVITLADTLANHHGCDSIMQLQLLVWPNVRAEADSTLCEGLYPLVWNTVTFDSAGTDSTLLVNMHGADSLLTMHVYTWWNTYSTLADTVVENQLPHPFNYASLSAPRPFDDISQRTTTIDTLITIANSHGCDSLISYSLLIHWNIHTSYDSTICDDRLPLSWGLTPFKPSAADSLLLRQGHTVVLTRSDTMTAFSGADSVVSLTLHINPTYRYHHSDTICDDATYTFLDSVYHATGTYDHLFASSHGCDSVETLHLMVHMVTYSDVNDTVVQNALPYTYNGALFDATAPAPARHYIPSPENIDHDTVTITNTAGCDSIIDYRLFVYWNVYDTLDSNVCEGQLPLQWNHRTFVHDHIDMTLFTPSQPVTMTLLDTLTAHNGADSLLTMNLTVRANSHDQWADTVVENVLPYLFLDSVFYDSVSHTDVVTPSANGCDSVFDFSLHVWWNDITVVDTGVCVTNLPFQYKNHLFDSAGVQYDSLHTIHGADSIIHITLTVWPTYYNRSYDTICDYSGIMIQGLEYIGIQYLSSEHLCDSVCEFHLWGNPGSNVTIHDTVAESQMPYSYNGQTYTQPVMGEQFVYTNRYGCDSIIHFSLSVFPTVTSFDDSTVCWNRLPLTWGNVTFTAAGNLNDTLRSAMGGDSIVTRRLHVTQDIVTNIYDTACSNVGFPYFDTVYYAGGEPIDSVHYTAINGCDSLVRLFLTVYHPTTSTVVDTIPAGMLPYNYHGYLFTGDVSDTTLTINNVHGCDSTIDYTLHIYYSDTTYLDTTLCENLLPVTLHGVTFTGPQTLQSNHMGINGVDSILVITLHTWPSYQHTDSLVVCDTLLWQDGQHYTASTTTPTVSYNTLHGCDSTLHLNLTVNHSSHRTDVVSACSQYKWIDSVTYRADTFGAQYFSITVDGCDSIVILDLAIHQPFYHESTDTICTGTTFRFNDRDLTATGIYYDSLLTIYGCDSIYKEDLVVLAKPLVSFSKEYNCESRLYTITGTTDVPYHVWSSTPEDPYVTGHETDNTIVVKPLTHTTYYYLADYYDVPTCPTVDTLYLSPLLKPHAAIETTPNFLTVDQLHSTAINRSQNEESHTWYVNGDPYGHDTRISYFADVKDDSVLYELVAVNGVCKDSARAIIPFRRSTFYAANVFTPGEASNNVFYVKADGVVTYEITIYTRGGDFVWSSTDIEEGWDGTHNGRPCPQGAYVYVIHYTDVTMPEMKQKYIGTVTLLR